MVTGRGSLDGRVVILTGAAGHLGRPMAHAIVDAGGEVIVSGRSADALASLRDEISADKRERCHAVVGDLASTHGVTAFCRDIAGRFEAIHGIVNNAYFGRVGSLDMIEAPDFLLASQLNLIAPFLLVRDLLPQLKRASRGPGGASVINIASMYGKVSPDPSIYADPAASNPAHYGASKAGLIHLTRYLACHLGREGVRVNSVSPGPFPRDTAEGPTADLLDNLSRKVPMGRIGRSEEVAGPVVFLLSAAASYVNGIDLAVDGGWTAW